METKHQSILVLGSNGLVGSALVRGLKQQGYENILPLVTWLVKIASIIGYEGRILWDITKPNQTEL